MRLGGPDRDGDAARDPIHSSQSRGGNDSGAAPRPILRPVTPIEPRDDPRGDRRFSKGAWTDRWGPAASRCAQVRGRLGGPLTTATRRTEAILLRSIAYRDADRIVTLLTRSEGKIAALARGARSSRRRFGAALEPYAIISVGLRPARGDLWQLADAEVSQAFAGILTDLDAMRAAGAALALLRGLAQADHADERLFDATVTFLDAVSNPAQRSTGRAEAMLLAFFFRALAVTGLSPALDSCFRCGKRPTDGQAACFDAIHGSVVCRDCGGAALILSGDDRRRMQQALTPAFVAAAAGWSRAAIAELAVAVGAFLGSHLDMSAAEPSLLLLRGAAPRSPEAAPGKRQVALVDAGSPTEKR